MNGAVIPNTPIAVDFWRVRRCPHSRIFFLSHMHADHTAGLTSSWSSYTIYCSEVTRKLAIAKLRVKSELVVGLPLNDPVTINLDEAGKETMTVTLLDANHCPGSVMFIFQGYFGTILYTGDFRFCEHLLTHSAIKGKQFDILYLDNTYCHPKCFFPTRPCATIAIMEIIRNHPQHKIVIGLHSLGKEALLHSIAISCKCWIGVDPSRKETLELLGMPHVFTCDVDRTRIRVVNFQEVNKGNIHLWNITEPTIAILPTCLFVGEVYNPYENVPNVFVVPYSDHSSFEELKTFVKGIRPRKIIPIVHKHRLSADETFNSRVNMNIFQALMDSSSSQGFSIPHSVECFMSPEMRQDVKKRVKAGTKAGTRKIAKMKKACGIVFPPSQDLCVEQDCGGLVNGELKDKLQVDSDVYHGVGEKVRIQERKAVMSFSVKNECESGQKVKSEEDGGYKDVPIPGEKLSDKVRPFNFFVKQDVLINEKVNECQNEKVMAEDTNHTESALGFFTIKPAGDVKKEEVGGDDKHTEMVDEMTSAEGSKFAVLKIDGSGKKAREYDDDCFEKEEHKVATPSTHDGNAGKKRVVDDVKDNGDYKDAATGDKSSENVKPVYFLIKHGSSVMDEKVKVCINGCSTATETNNGMSSIVSHFDKQASDLMGNDNDVNMADLDETSGKDRNFALIKKDSCSWKKGREDNKDNDVGKVEGKENERHKVVFPSIQRDNFRKRIQMDDNQDVKMAQEADVEGKQHHTLESQFDMNDFECEVETSDDELFAVASCYQRDPSGICQQGGINTSNEKPAMTSQNSMEIGNCSDRFANNSCKNKKFNIFTGHTCDFARKVLQDMVRNGAL